MLGYVPLYRKIKDWEWYTEANTMRLFIHCLVTANHKDNKWRGVTVKKGSFITSVANLANDLNLSSQKIRTALNNLKSTNEITIQSTNKYTIINVVNWSLYAIGDVQDNKQDNNQLTINQQSNNKQITTNNNDKNLENDNNEKKEDIVPYREIVDYFNEKFKDANVPKVRDITHNRKTGMDTRSKKYDLKKLIDKAASSDFLSGKIKDNGFFNFDWLIKPANAAKVMEGNYDNVKNFNQYTKPKSMKDNQTSLENNYGATRI